MDRGYACRGKVGAGRDSDEVGSGGAGVGALTPHPREKKHGWVGPNSSLTPWAVRWGVGPNSPPPPHPTRHSWQGGTTVQAQYKHVSYGEWRGWAPLSGKALTSLPPPRMRALLQTPHGPQVQDGSREPWPAATRVNG